MLRVFKSQNKKKSQVKKKTIIGMTDHIDLPEFKMFDVPCKIDTGAATSSIHCERIKILESDGIEYLKFTILDPSFPQYTGRRIKTKDFIEKSVRSSFGEREYRYEIKTNLIIFGKKYRVSFNLSKRGEMRFPILLGRKFLRNKFVVDISTKDISFEKKAELRAMSEENKK